MDEDKLITIVKPYLDNCRAGDWNHALRVVNWVKTLGKGRVDFDLLVTAAYIHDIGWFNVLPKGKLDFQEMLLHEEKANKNTPKFVNEVLSKMSFSKKDITTVIRLIKAADKHESEKDDEAIIVDADNLSKLCIEHVQEKYKPESYQEVISSWEVELPTRLKTEKGKSIYLELLENLKKKLL